MQRKQKQKNKIKGQKFESKIQKTINSGSLWFDKGDLKTDEYLIECKYTDKKGFRISTKILQKLWNEALESNKLPALVIGIQEEDIIWELQVQINRKTK